MEFYLKVNGINNIDYKLKNKYHENTKHNRKH